MEPKDQVKVVLKWVNEQRKLRELPPIRKLPKGDRSNRNECPVARGLSAEHDAISCASWGWKKEDSQTWHPVPPEVGDFIRRFDTGKAFKDYVDEG